MTFTLRPPEVAPNQNKSSLGASRFLARPSPRTELPSVQGHGELRSGPEAACQAARFPPALVEPSDRHGCRAACHGPGSGRLLLLAVLSRRTCSHSTEMLLCGNRCAAGDGEGEQRALNIPTMTSVPSQGRR